jgi:DNA-3-methyladenine glycosylase II
MKEAIAITHLKQSDPILGQIIEQIDTFELAHLPPETDLLTAVAQAIIYQQISTQVAAKIYQRLLQLYHQSDAQTLTAQVLLDTPEETLRSVGISRPKIRYLKDLAQKIIQGFPTLSELATMEDEAVIQTLIQIKGVGRWTAQMLLIFHLRRPDVLPVDDLGIRSAIAKLYGLDSLPDPKTIEQLARKWQPYRSIACRYLWLSLAL